jgi:membrane-associated phospholipid phosphatase
MRRRAVAVVLLLAAFGVVAGLVVSGTLQGVDEFAVDHWMPGFEPTSTTGLDWRGLWRPFALDEPVWQKALDLWMYPASVLVSGLVVAVATVLFRRRGQVRMAAIWSSAWLIGNAIELAGKSALDRPRLRWAHDGVRTVIPSFHNSFPSGHTIRSLVVVAIVVSLWPRARRPAIVWALLVLPFLVVRADHTPSDVLGGLCVGLALLLVARSAAVAS